MKRFLPILTLALLGAAVTASASNYYYDYYLNPPKSDISKNSITDANGYTRTNESDYFTYGTRDNAGKEITNPDVFTVNRELNWDGKFIFSGANTNYYRIEFANYENGIDPETGETTVKRVANTGEVTLYLTDYVSEVVNPAAVNPTNSSTNALFNKGIVEYGYRTLELKDGKYVAGNTVSRSIYLLDDDGNFVTDADGNKILNSQYVTPADTIDYNKDDGKVMTRYKYELGTFGPDDIIEIYMKDAQGKEIYSFSSNENGVYVPFDKNTYETNSTTYTYKDEVSGETQSTGGLQGGFGDGGWRVGLANTDAMLSSYYFVEDVPNPDYHEESLYNFDPNGNITLASRKAMPLSYLIPNSYNTKDGFQTGTWVAFGIYGVTVGKPLPGGLQMALIAGLFGLGFCYIRRRKAIVG